MQVLLPLRSPPVLLQHSSQARPPTLWAPIFPPLTPTRVAAPSQDCRLPEARTTTSVTSGIPRVQRDLDWQVGLSLPKMDLR